MSQSNRGPFKAVRKPVEGTILTVLRDVSRCADACSRGKLSVPDTLQALVVEAYESVARTPDLLPVLKENGVVDSGAYGFATFLEAFVNAYLGKEGSASKFMTTFDSAPAGDAAKNALQARVAIENNNDWEGSQYRYCTEFLFRADSSGIDEAAVLAFLAAKGDCELLVGAHPSYKVHIHTNQPDQVLRYMLKYGQIFEVFIHNMDLEIAERAANIATEQREHNQKKAGSQRESASERTKDFGVVAVAPGVGMADILRSLGVDIVVRGGQTMNPSTADILDALREVDARRIIVLPNSSNVRMAAEAAAVACDFSEVVVVPTKTVPQAFAAMFAVNETASLAENVEEMSAAITEVRSGEVTTAVRDSRAADGTPIHTGDVMGIVDGSIEVVGNDVQQVTLDVVARMQSAEPGDTLTLLAGSDLDDQSFTAATVQNNALDETTLQKNLTPVCYQNETYEKDSTFSKHTIRANGVQVRNDVCFGQDILRDISCEVRAGEIVLIIGSSGAGKTTLATSLAGVQRLDAGEVLLDGKRVKPGRVGLAFQRVEDQLFCDTVFDDVAFGPRNLAFSEEDASVCVEHALATVGLSPALARRNPLELSGGQRRLVALAGVIALEAAAYVFDEPLAGLDVSARRSFRALVKLLAKEGVPIIIVTHDVIEWVDAADRVVGIAHGEIMWERPAKDLFSDPKLFSAVDLAVPPAVALRLCGKERKEDAV